MKQKTIEERLTEQAERRKANIGKPPHDNSKDYAGSPMVFNCTGCYEEIYVPEDYTPPRRTMCRECDDLAYVIKHSK